MRKSILLTCIFAAIAASLYSQTPVVNAKKRSATLTIDGNPSETIWQFSNTVTKAIIGTPNNTTTYAVLWDSLYLYVAFKVIDAAKFNDSANPWDDDAVEIYIDAENNGGTTYGINDRQFVKEWNGTTIWEKNNKITGLTHAWAAITGGYAVEIRIPWSNIGITNPALGFTIGFDIASNDDDDGSVRESQQMWAGDANNWQYPQNFGDLVLVSATDTQAPTAPANLAVSALTQSSLTLTWSASTDNTAVAGYDIYRNGVKTFAVTGTSINITGLTAATAYQFYVRARDAANNNSGNSNTINVTTPDTQAPTAPLNLTASNITPVSMTLSWVASTDNVGVTGYDLYRNGIKINPSLLTTTSYLLNGLTPSTAYQFYLRAWDAAGNFSTSITINPSTPAIPDTQAPSIPANLTASAITQSSLLLNWSASTDNVGVTGYDVYRNGIKINSSNVTGTSFSVTGLSASVSYSFYVTARDAIGNISANSNAISIITPDTQAPTIPTNLAASAITQNSLLLNWTPSSDNVAVTGYDIYQNNSKINTLPVTTNSFPVTGLASSTNYAFYIKALDAAGNTSNSSISNFSTLAPPDLEAPSSPTGLTGSAITQSSLTLSWNAATDNIAVTGYDIFQNGIKVNTSNVTTTSFNITGLAALISYDFYIVAKDAAGNISSASNILNVVTPDTQIPSTPSGLAASGITATSVMLNWNASTDNIAVTGYDIYQNGIKINPAPVIVTSYTVEGLSQASAYSFYVRALDAAGNVSAISNSINISTPDIQPPSVPTGLAASAITQSSLTLNWNTATDNVAVTGYDIYQNGVKINSANVTNTSFNVTGLTALVSYDFYIIAKDAAGNISGGSDVVNVITPDTQIPTAPSALVSSNITSTSVILSWNASSDNIGVTGYDIYQNGIKINSTLVAGLSYSVTGLSQANSYSFYIRAIDGAGNVSAISNSVNVSTPDIQVPSAPSALAVSNLAFASLTLGWTASSDNVGVTGYDIYRNGIRINTALVTALNYSVTGLTASTAYSFYIQARDAAGNISANSNTVAITTPVAPGCTGTGTINFQRWNNVTGTSVASLTSVAGYPNTASATGTLTSFEIPINSADNYGMRLYGYICPPTTGSYTFWIASDDNSELWLSTNSNPANKVRIAYHVQWTNSREWNKYTTQKSAAITLTAGTLYYVEALMKDGTGGDNMAVGWAKPGQATTTASEVIPGSQLLTTIPDAQAPTTPANLAALNIGQTTFLLNWTPSTDNIAVAGYDVYRNGVKINTALISGASYNVTGLTAGSLYSFTVVAKDLAGNSSATSTALPVSTIPVQAGAETFTQKTIIAAQRMPHDLVYGPDNNIWYTERFGGTVSFVNPATSVKTVLLSLGSKMVRVGGQDGLMGLALHPQLLTGKPYVYISYTYQSTSATVRRTRIERYTYDITTKTLGQAVTILENIPGSNDHNSARLAIGPDLKLYYTAGDMGAGQFDNMTRTNNAQNLTVYEGKVLRLNTEAIAGSWIPTDNPFSNAGLPTAVYSLGHRNPQGLVWGNVNGTNILYSSEHGPYSDDEVNIIESGRNYGWPQVSGFCDGNYNGRTIGGFAVVSEQNNCATLNAREPLRSLFPASNPPSDGDNMTWPSTGPSGTDFYGSNAIPGWQNSLLIAQLKNGSMTRFKLSSDGKNIISDTIHYFRGIGRFRDVVVSPDGLKIYLACDSSGSTSGPTGGVTATPANPGSILEFTYQAPVGARGSNQLITQNKLQAEETDKSIDVYPNPASTFMVVYNYGNEPGRIAELYDMNGKVLKKHTVNSIATRIAVDNISAGLYVLKITDAKGRIIKTEKIIIQK